MHACTRVSGREGGVLTAGNAKKEMANTEKQDATILPIHVCGTVSPYPMVVTVICKSGADRGRLIRVMSVGIDTSNLAGWPYNVVHLRLMHAL
jgi:hypothetical protein